MDPRRGLAQALTALCLCACVAARPGASSDALTAQQSNAITVDEAKAGKPVAATPQTTELEKTEEATLASEPPSPVATEQTGTEVAPQSLASEQTAPATEAANATAAPPPPPPRLIERYPQAVLYGGTCGGTIISSKWILTAAHCTIFTAGRYVLAGTSSMADGSGVRRRVKRLVIHPLFAVGPYWLDAERFGIKQVGARWDFLLAELEQPLPLDGRTMAAAELSSDAHPPPGLAVGYAGYGAEHHGETMRTEMHGMELEILPDGNCSSVLEQFDGTEMICTRGRPPRFDSACNGDSGSGLLADGTLYGVASWVQDDAVRCFNGALVVFSKVAAVRDWIRQVTKI